MQHPFEGVMGAGQEPAEARSTRRWALGRMLGAVAALFGAGAVASAQTPGRRPTTLAYGEEGGWWPPRGRWATTYAVGEEGGWRPPRVPPVRPVPPPRRPTTLAFGEEGGVVTTYALGEEGGVITTYALGEEGGRY
jgi:hypothetical protein